MSGSVDVVVDLLMWSGKVAGEGMIARERGGRRGDG